MTSTRVQSAISIHYEDAAETFGVATRDRLILVTAQIGRHDEDLVDTRALAVTFARRLFDLSEINSADNGQGVLARETTLTLGLFTATASLSFTFVQLGRTHVDIWNCGGHRVVGISKGVVSCVVADGFYPTDDPLYRGFLVGAASSGRPVAVHYASVSVAIPSLLVFSPHPELPFVSGIERATNISDIQYVLETEDPLRRYSLAAIEVRPPKDPPSGPSQ